MSTSLSIADHNAAPSANASSRGLDGAELEALYKECARDVHAYAISLLGDRAAAEDVTALAFERLYRARRRLDRSRGTPKALLFAIARNAALDELRRARRQFTFDIDLSLPHDPTSAEAFEQVERRALVHAALAALPLRERERAAEETWLAGLDAALNGEREDAAAAEWRQLANDVRSLPPAISEDFELSLQRRQRNERQRSRQREQRCCERRTGRRGGACDRRARRRAPTRVQHECRTGDVRLA